MLPRHFNHIVDSGVLRVGYFKSPDIAYEASGNSFGYEYQILKRFADKYSLTIKLIPITSETVNYALNLSKIDIAMGGFIKHNIDDRFFQASAPFESQAIVAVERRKKNIAASRTFDFPVHFGKRLNHLPKNELVDIIAIHSSHDELSLFDQLSEGEIDLVGTTLARLRILHRFYPDIRRVNQINDLRVEVAWLFGKRVNASFAEKINHFLNDEKTILFMQRLKESAHKEPNALHYLDILNLNEHIRTRLPQFERWFKQAGSEYDVDWVTLAAMAYQESKWSVNAVSPTKVRGIMQMTTKTATALGIENRIDPYSTIFGAAKYIKSLEKRVPQRITGNDRMLIAIGAYNIGFGNILKAYRAARKGNIKTITWGDIAKQLPQLRINSLAKPIKEENGSQSKEKKTYARGKQAVNYVTRVKEFSEILRYYAAD